MGGVNGPNESRMGKKWKKEKMNNKERKNLENYYQQLMKVENWENIPIEKALNLLGVLIDISLDLKRPEGLQKALNLSKELEKRKGISSEQKALLYYFVSNAWSNLKCVKEKNSSENWNWRAKEIGNSLLYLRRCIKEEGFKKLPSIRKAQIYTNLGNTFSEIGRSVESIEYFDKALKIFPNFPMALGNKGEALLSLAGILYDPCHREVLLRHAYENLDKALSYSQKYQIRDSAKIEFEKTLKKIEEFPFQCGNQNINLNNFSLGDSIEEISYRKWALEHRLFLNPLNDIGSYSLAARDVLTTPSIIVREGEGPYYHGFYNQMKQEFVSARYLYYEGINSYEPHFSDREVLLYNTLDYPVYSFSAEKIKIAFRMVYSILDKLSYFLNDYLRLNINERRVSFKSFWYEKQDRQKGLRKEFVNRPNWPLRGLFWLSKDLFESTPGFKEYLEPEAQELHKVRNCLEHRYLKLHSEEWPRLQKNGFFIDHLAFSMSRFDFEAKALKLLKLVRSALIYLSLAIHVEECLRNRNLKSSTIVSMQLDVWKDEWKI